MRIFFLLVFTLAGVTYADYCSASGGCDEYIDSVHFYLTHNKNTGCMGYDGRLWSNMELQKGRSYELVVKNGKSYSGDQCWAWIDWNQNETFEWDDETYILTSTYDHFYTTVTVPTDAAIGRTRLRIRVNWSGTMSPCGATTYGEVEDHEVVIAQQSQSQVIFESATMGPMDQTSGYSFSDTEFRGVRFELTEPTQITAVGAHIVSMQESEDNALVDFYVVELSGPTGFPTSTLFPAWGVTGWFPPEISMDFRLRMSDNMAVLQPGWYALVVRFNDTFPSSGLLPSDGQTSINSPSYIFKTSSDSWLNSYLIGAPRFVIEGYTVNQNPNTPENPVPWDGLHGVSQTPNPIWTEQNDLTIPTVYDVYLDTINPPISKIASDLSEKNHPVSGLLPDTTYYWQIIAKANSAQKSGPVWSFKTEQLQTTPVLPKYHIIDLGVMETGYYHEMPTHSSRALALNDSGHIVGTTENSIYNSTTTTFFWHDENANKISDPNEMRRAEDISEAGSNETSDVSNNGLVVGAVEDSNLNTQGFYWWDQNNNRTVDPGECDVLSQPSTPLLLRNRANAKACNDNYKAVGVVNVEETSSYYMRASVWNVTTNTYTLLGTFGGDESAAIGLNNLNHVVGYADTDEEDVSHGFIWIDGNADEAWQSTEMVEFDTFGGKTSRIYDINIKGHAVGGASISAGHIEALFWADLNGNGQCEIEEMQKINDPNVVCLANAINDKDQIVGYEYPAQIYGSENAFYWDPNNGRVKLIDLVCNKGNWRHLQRANDINNNGWITGYGVVDDTATQAFLMIPEYAITDFNCDGCIDLSDFARLSAEWETEKTRTDIQPCGGDGITNLKDFAQFAKKWGGDYPLYPYDVQADFNYDKYVDINDLTILCGNFLKRNVHNADMAPWPGLDGAVDLLDLVTFAEKWLTSD